MTRLAHLVALPIILSSASASAAEDRCLAGTYRPPASIVAEMRPYLVCGMIRGYGHHSVRLNGVSVTMNGGGPEACGTLRAAAFEASDRRLAATLPDADDRRRILEAEFDSADRFMRIAARSEDLGLGEEPTAPLCRSAG
jgi:hypothetical protein